MGQLISGKSSSKSNDRSGLTLYYHPLSYYSQKVSLLLKISRFWFHSNVRSQSTIDGNKLTILGRLVFLRYHVIFIRAIIWFVCFCSTRKINKPHILVGSVSFPFKESTGVRTVLYGNVVASFFCLFLPLYVCCVTIRYIYSIDCLLSNNSSQPHNET